MHKTLPFVKGFALQNYLSAEEGILNAADNHYHYWYIDGSLSTDIVSLWNPERIYNLTNTIKKFNVLPIFHGNYKVPLASDVIELREAAIDYTKKEIDLAEKLSAPLIIHAGAIVEPRLVIKTKQKAIQNYISSLKILLTYAKNKDVDIYLENLSDYQFYRPFHYIFTRDEEFSSVLDEIPEIRLFLDLGHANVGGNHPIKLIEKYFQYIVGMSFSNNNGMQDQHFTFKKGNINYYEVISTIDKLGWQGIIAMETRGISRPYKNILEVNSIYKKLDLLKKSDNNRVML
jgi:L-ribulose-5-phosphate 3-epimerase